MCSGCNCASNNSDPRLISFIKKAVDQAIEDTSWDRIAAMDERIAIGEAGFKRLLSPNERCALLKYLQSQVKSIHQIENELVKKWGITEKLLEFGFAAGGPFNNAVVGISGAVDFCLGAPNGYSEFFASPASLIAHELGHYLSYFSPDGGIRYTTDTLIKNAEADKFSLNSEGNLDSKYLEDIPYNLLPPQLLFSYEPDGNELHYYANELLADKIALQLCGFEKSRKRIKVKIEKGMTSNNPWQLLHLAVLAREYNFECYEGVLLEGIYKRQHLWINEVQTDELIDLLSEFFQKVSLRHQ